MTDAEGEMLLLDRVMKIQQIIEKYGEETFSISFSGGKDSTVLFYLIDEAIPGNKIPRVHVDTGIEFRAIEEFVRQLAEKDERVVIVRPKVNIKKMLEAEGYPFKSKHHSMVMRTFQNAGMTQYVQTYYTGILPDGRTPRWHEKSCPKVLKYQFEEGVPFKISDKCCDRLKKDPLNAYSKETGRKNQIIGIRREEGGRRDSAKCVAIKKTGSVHFQPLAVMTEEWLDWYIVSRGIKLCKLYYPPYNFTRTGCKGCPFAKEIQEKLETMQRYFPAERKQCEMIWKPVYEEYRRIGYRLKNEEQLDLFGELEEAT